ncbi:GcrA family cell cycle regulator [Roseomonas sp. F4]
MDWTAEAIERLRALWAEGHSTAEIGRRMGVSKNAVVGKAHRLNLPARPSPIRREAATERPVASAPRLPRPVGVVSRSTLAPAASAVPASPAPPPPPVAATSSVVRAFPRLGSTRSCCWPIGEPGTPDFRFCTAEALSGKPYCSQHAAVAYVKARDRREDAA